MSDSFGLIKGLKVTFKELFRKEWPKVKTIRFELGADGCMEVDYRDWKGSE